jgi:hypothetical protein
MVTVVGGAGEDECPLVVRVIDARPRIGADIEALVGAEDERDGVTNRVARHPRLSVAHSLAALLRCASMSFFSSAGDSFGRSIESVTLLSLPVKRNGTW